MKTAMPMRPLYAATLDAVTSIIRRHYLRPVTVSPVDGDPDRFDIIVNERRNRHTHVVIEDGRYKFCEVERTETTPSWDEDLD